MDLKRSFLKRKQKLQRWFVNRQYRSNLNYFDDVYKTTVTSMNGKVKSINKNLPQIHTNPQQIVFKENSSLPVLSWALKTNQDGKIIVNYGPDVHFFKDGIVEGIWDDSFKEYNFSNATHLFGSGITKKDDSIVISPPSHFYEGVFLLHNKVKNETYCSNSLNYVFQLAGDDLTDELANIVNSISEVNDTITSQGLFNPSTLLYQSNKLSLHVIHYHNLILNTSGYQLEPKIPTNHKYKDFNEYKIYLLSTLKKLRLNSLAPERNNTYETLTTLSNGYDSPAVAALLCEVGPVEAVTLDVEVYGRNDSGIEIADHLNITCHPCSHPLGKSIDMLHDIDYSDIFAKEVEEFIATIGYGDDVVFKAFDQYLDSKAVYTGHLGDSLWGIDCINKVGLPVGVIYSKSISEYRLQKNFCHVPIVVIGSAFPHAISRINTLKEMGKYHVKNDYNRPIPRKIIEDKGVPRGCFANEKNATNPHVSNISSFKHKAFKNIINRYSFIE